ncbi:hypothetical protein ACIGGF_02000 [Rhodococcus sp. NPDC078407]
MPQLTLGVLSRSGEYGEQSAAQVAGICTSLLSHRRILLGMNGSSM